MRIGQTSLVVFLSKLVSSILGFIATLYFARLLGAEVLGVYAVVMALASWLAIGTTMGVDNSIKKRISEGLDQGSYLLAGILLIGILYLLVSLVLLTGRSYVEGYVAAFSNYTEVSVVWFLLAILLGRLLLTLTYSVLHGSRLVHVAGVLQPVKIGGQSLIQIGLVLFGFGLIGMLAGHVVGLLLVVFISLSFIDIRPKIPRREHFKRLVDFAKYAWFGTIKSKTFTNVDILVLQALVATPLVGVYSVAWGISTFFNAFGGAITQAVFPEISNVTAKGDTEHARGMIEDALAYTGFIIIPGLVGGLLIGDRILRIYGPEFVQGTQVLGLLILSILFHNYMNQLLNALNAIDRPELPFRINGVFILTNLVLNVLLVLRFGWVGAAIASAVSTGFGLLLAHRALQGTMEVDFPWIEVSRQTVAAGIMGVIVWGLLSAVETTRIITHNFVIVVAIVLIGAGVYFMGLLAISPRFRSTIEANLVQELW